MNKDASKEAGQSEEETPKSCVLEQKLDSGADLRILIFEPDEIKLQFKYKYEQRPNPRAKRALINETMLEVGYFDGRLADCSLSMNIIVPPLLGKESFLGVDISPGAKTYVEFGYGLDKGWLCIKTVQVGAQPKIEFKVPDDFDKFRHLIPPPFLIFNEIPLQLRNDYLFAIPFLHNNGEKRFFEFKQNMLLRHSI